MGFEEEMSLDLSRTEIVGETLDKLTSRMRSKFAMTLVKGFVKYDCEHPSAASQGKSARHTYPIIPLGNALVVIGGSMLV